MITCRGIQEIEKRVFRTGISAETLMEKVGRRMAQVILRDHPISGRAEAYLGKGHNAGDALVVLRLLKQEGWQVSVNLAFPETEMAVLTRKKLRELGELGSDHDFRRGPHFLLDGMLGIGTEGSLREPLLGMAEEMNERRLNSGARVVAMDIPTGLDADTGGEGAVVADLTLTVGIPKLGLVADSATDFVGRLELIEVEELPLPEEGDRLISRPFLPPRPFSFHKGQAGRIGIIAGSPGLLGAAALACQGALRGGAGLITLWAEKELLSDLRAMVSPEVMIRELGDDWNEVCQLSPDALVIGPGLGTDCSDSLFRLLEKNQLPTVLDADALNLIATHERQDLLGANILATPHPGEMARLHVVDGTRAEITRSFSEAYPATLLYKGARTIVTRKGEPLFYNTTGTPAMATGGQGDLLSGVLGALLAGGQDLLSAACQGAWLAGRAAELALLDGESERSLTPGDVARHLGRAMKG